MGATALIALLADMPPHLWAETRLRFEVIEQYLDLERPSLQDADSAAAKLGLKRRMFYKLVRLVSEARAGVLPPPSRQGQHQHLPRSVERVISQALEETGDDASLAQVHSKAKRLSAERGLPSPSLQAVRWRLGEAPRRPRLKSRFRTEADLVADASAMGIDVVGSDGASEPAFISAVLNAENGMVLAHDVTAGPPTALQLLRMLASIKNVAADAQHGLRSVTANREIVRSLGKASALLDELGVELDHAAPAFAPGAALLHVFGLRIGRIPLLPRRRVATNSTGVDALPLGDVQPVVAALVTARNAEIKASAGEATSLPGSSPVTPQT